MRDVLVHCARRRYALKRGGTEARNIEIEEQMLIDRDSLGTCCVDEALEHLAGLDRRQSRLIEMRFFADLSVEEAAGVMGLSTVTVTREWRPAKALASTQARARDDILAAT